ncbi:MAG: hypothetical protein N2506_04340, partial [Dehalococcoidales bacterium]|nr:hypothetical protein [Dehalococcoidales bacterium]
IALCIYDGLARIGGMAHVVLPVHDGAAAASPARFADTSVPFLVGQVIRHGGSRQHLLAKIAGGAQMTLARGLRDTFKTGERNLAAIKAALARDGIELVAADVGGTMGRTVKLYVATGKLMVRTVGGDTKEL